MGERQAHRPIEISLLVNPATAWARSIIAGVGDYSRSRGGWVLRFETTGGRQTEYLPKHWHGDGIVARIVDQEQHDDLMRLGVPLVNVGGIRSWPGVHNVSVNTERIATMAAEHLIDQGLRHFGFLGVKRFSPSRERWRLFRDAVEPAAESVDCWELSRRVGTGTQASEQRAQLIDWLSKGPQPIGLLAWSDEQARVALEACQMANLAVPEQVSILGVDNDELICNLTSPPLSSIELGIDRIGYRAAELLESMLDGSEAPSEGVHLLDPIGVLARQSTSLLALEDQKVADALRFIGDRVDGPLQVGEVVASVGVSRRNLERRFKAATGRSVAAEIRREKLERARRLLLDTDLPVSQVAYRCGYEYPEHFITTFRREIGEPPQRFRERMMRKQRHDPHQ